VLKSEQIAIKARNFHCFHAYKLIIPFLYDFRISGGDWASIAPLEVSNFVARRGAKTAACASAPPA
jgi:hypothetical protein